MMNEILKRLELIKTGIEIQDTDTIELQIKKLKSFPLDNEVLDIINKLKKNDYGTAVTDIENYVAQFVGIVVFEDKKIQELKFELKVLEKQLQEIISKKNDYINDIEEFNIMYRLKLGGLISKILEIEKKILRDQVIEKEKIFEGKKKEYEQIKNEYKDLKKKQESLEKELDDMDEFDDAFDEVYEKLQELKKDLKIKEKVLNEKRKDAKQAKEELGDDSTRKKYEEAENDYKEFCNDYFEVLNKERNELTDDEKIELKQLYRKAVKLCHPDIVINELQLQAKSIIQELNDAYDKRDLLKVQEILFSLKNGKSFDIDSAIINDKEILIEKIVEIRQKIAVLEQEIDEIITDETFQTIQEIDDWDAYFEEMEGTLQKQYENLLNSCFMDCKEPPVKQTMEPDFDFESMDDDYWERKF
jgi:hypothetical protein